MLLNVILTLALSFGAALAGHPYGVKWSKPGGHHHHLAQSSDDDVSAAMLIKALNYTRVIN